MSWRDDLADKYERVCGLNPEALGIGGTIDRSAKPWWRNKEMDAYLMSDGEMVNLAIDGDGAVTRIPFQTNAVMVQIFEGEDEEGNPTYTPVVSLICKDEHLLPLLREKAHRIIESLRQT